MFYELDVVFEVFYFDLCKCGMGVFVWSFMELLKWLLLDDL